MKGRQRCEAKEASRNIALHGAKTCDAGHTKECVVAVRARIGIQTRRVMDESKKYEGNECQAEEPLNKYEA